MGSRTLRWVLWIGVLPAGLNLVERREARLLMADLVARQQVSERSNEAVGAIDREVSATMARLVSLSGRIDQMKPPTTDALSRADSDELERLIAERTATMSRYEALQVERSRALEVYDATALHPEDGGVGDMLRLWAEYRWRWLTRADS
jgi:hypothetical protein